MPEPAVHPLVLSFRERGQRIRDFSTGHERAILIWTATFFIVAVSLVGLWKLWSFGYNGLDLAIYRQVMTNSLHGHLFAFTIHPSSFLGDHLELMIIPLLPIFALAPFPLTLIALQAAALAVTVFPLSKILSKIVGSPWNLFFVFAFIANPIIQNTAVFEFHMLPFAVPIITFALLAYVEKKYWKFLVLGVVAMAVREDVSLVIIGFGLWALLERRSQRWSIVPILVGTGWLAAALAITAHFNGLGQYKFLSYYGWLGNSVHSVIATALSRPWLVIGHIFSLTNLKFLLVLLMPFAFLPLWRGRWFIPVFLTMMQLLLLPITGELITEIHYPVLLIPFLVVGMAAGWQKIVSAPKESFWTKFGGKTEISAVVFLFIVYGMVTLGPAAQAIPILSSRQSIADRVQLEQDIINDLPLGGTVASYETLPALANRSSLYSLHYVFLGHKQFSSETYVLPQDASVILMDLRDFLLYQLQYPTTDESGRHGYARIRQLLAERHFAVTSYVDRFVVLQKSNTDKSLDQLFTVTSATPVTDYATTHGNLRLVGVSFPTGKLQAQQLEIHRAARAVLPVTLTFQKMYQSSEILPIEFDLYRQSALVYRQVLPLGGGIYPTSDWPLDQTVSSSYQLLIPAALRGQHLTASAKVLDISGGVVLNSFRTLTINYSHYQQLGPTIDLGEFTP